MTRRPGQGRKRKLTKQTVKQMLKKAKSGKAAPEIARSYNRNQENKADTITPRTVQRTLKREGLKYLGVTPREELSSAQIDKRVAYARRRLHYDWTYTLFTDEKSFLLGASEAKAWQDPNHRKTRKKAIPSKQRHVWGGTGPCFKARLYFFEQNLTGQLYREILNKRLPVHQTVRAHTRCLGITAR